MKFGQTAGILLLAFFLSLSQKTNAQTIYADTDCGAPLAEHMGVPARSNAGSTGSHNDCGDRPARPGHPYTTTSIDGDPFQCVEYVRRFYREALGVNTGAASWRGLSGGAVDFFYRYGSMGLVRYVDGRDSAGTGEPFAGSAPPQPGDIVVFGAVVGNPAGHVGIVKNVTPASVTIVEQNFARYTGTATLRITRTNARYSLTRFRSDGSESPYKVLGWLRKREPPNPVTYLFTGFVSSFNTTASQAQLQSLGLNVAVGARFAGTITYDSNASVSRSSTVLHTFVGAMTNFRVQFLTGRELLLTQSDPEIENHAQVLLNTGQPPFSFVNFQAPLQILGAGRNIGAGITLFTELPYLPSQPRIPVNLLSIGQYDAAEHLSVRFPGEASVGFSGRLDSLTRQ